MGQGSSCSPETCGDSQKACGDVFLGEDITSLDALEAPAPEIPMSIEQRLQASAEALRSMEPTSSRPYLRTTTVYHRMALLPHLLYRFSECYRLERLLVDAPAGKLYEAVSLFARAPHDRNPIEVDMKQLEAGEPRRVRVKISALQTEKGEKGRQTPSPKTFAERERTFLAELDHPHIVKMHEAFEDSDQLMLVLELAAGGSLYERIAQTLSAGEIRGGLPEKVARTFFRQMLLALSYLSVLMLCHRDIKCQSFVLTGNAEAEVVKLCDFGHAARLSTGLHRITERVQVGQTQTQDIVGLQCYTAPEIYRNKGAALAADAWALGVVFFAMLLAASPYQASPSDPPEDTVRRVLQGDLLKTRSGFGDLSTEAQDLLLRFLEVGENARVKPKQALDHKWVHISIAELLPPLDHGMDSLQDFGENGAKIGLAILELMKYFSRLDCVKKLILLLCAQTISEDDLYSVCKPIPWYSIFFLLDGDRDGQLGIDELCVGITRLLPTRHLPPASKMERYVRALDVESKGAVGWREWVALALVSPEPLKGQAEILRSAFRILDRPTADGAINAPDLAALLDSGASSFETNHITKVLAHWSSPSLPAFPREQTGGSTSGRGFEETADAAADDSKLQREGTEEGKSQTPRTRGQRLSQMYSPARKNVTGVRLGASVETRNFSPQMSLQDVGHVLDVVMQGLNSSALQALGYHEPPSEAPLFSF